MTTITQTRPSFSPLNLESRSPAMRLAAVALGTLVLAISSQIEVPMIPVPITLQTLTSGPCRRRWWSSAFRRPDRRLSRFLPDHRRADRLSGRTRLER